MRKLPGSLILLILLVFFALSPLSLYSQRRSANHVIGTVDFRALVLLHPAMAKYEPNKQAFKVDASRMEGAQLEARRKEHQKRISDFSAQARRFQAQITEHHRNYEREMARLSNTYLEKMKRNPATASAAVETQTYNLNRKLAETRHRSKLRMVGDQLAGVNDQLAQLQRISYHAGHSAPEETRKRFAAIVNEVKQYVQQVATQKGMEIVLNSGFRRSFSMADQTLKRRMVPPGHSYESILNAPFQNPQDEQMKSMDSYVSGYYSNLSDLTRDWLKHENSILEPFTADFVDTDIIIGGVDITAEVLAALFRRYKINENIGNAIIQAATNR